jgi:iron complex outermembrane receptor protein
VPAGSNLSNIILANVGSLRNQGLEFSADWTVLQRKNLRWELGLNLATNRNRILSLGPTPELNFRAISAGGINGGVGNTIQIFQIDQPLNAFYVFNHRRDAAGRPLVDGVDHNGDGRIDLADIYTDTNADGVVNDQDKRAWQQPAPTLFGGLQSQLRAGNWGLLLAWRGQLGNYVYNNIAALGDPLERIRTEPVLLNLPRSSERAGFQTAQYFSDYYVEKAAFLRLDALTIDYTFLSPEHEPRLRLYGTVQNVFTLTTYRGLDPEIGNVSGNPSEPRFGIDDRVFPRARTFLVGVNLRL